MMKTCIVETLTPPMVNAVVRGHERRAVDPGVRQLLAADPEQHGVLKEDRDADRRDQRRESRRVPQRPVREPLDDDMPRNPDDDGRDAGTSRRCSADESDRR